MCVSALAKTHLSIHGVSQAHQHSPLTTHRLLEYTHNLTFIAIIPIFGTEWHKLLYLGLAVLMVKWKTKTWSPWEHTGCCLPEMRLPHLVADLMWWWDEEYIKHLNCVQRVRPKIITSPQTTHNYAHRHVAEHFLLRQSAASSRNGVRRTFATLRFRLTVQCKPQWSLWIRCDLE